MDEKNALLKSDIIFWYIFIEMDRFEKQYPKILKWFFFVWISFISNFAFVSWRFAIVQSTILWHEKMNLMGEIYFIIVEYNLDKLNLHRTNYKVW